MSGAADDFGRTTIVPRSTRAIQPVDEQRVREIVREMLGERAAAALRTDDDTAAHFHEAADEWLANSAHLIHLASTPVRRPSRLRAALTGCVRRVRAWSQRMHASDAPQDGRAAS